MSILSPALARRIDRLSRRAHRFHRYAHHPLCDRYAREVVRAGRRARICLGCALAAAGTLVGLLVGISSPPLPAAVPLAAAAALALGAPRASRRRRSGAGAGAAARVASRFVPSLLGAALAAHAFRAPSAATLASAALAAGAVAAAVVLYRRRGPDRAACEGCPAGPPSLECPGYAPIAARERALRRLAGGWIAQDATPPRPARATLPGIPSSRRA